MNGFDPIYRFWHEEEKKMYDVIKMAFNEHGIVDAIVGAAEEEDNIVEYEFDTIDGEIMISTGLNDSKNNVIFIDDLVECKFIEDGKPRFIFWDNGFRVFGVTGGELEDNLDMVEVVGNRYTHPEKYEEYKTNFKLN